MFACNCAVKIYDRALQCGVVVLIGAGGVTANCFFSSDVSINFTLFHQYVETTDVS